MEARWETAVGGTYGGRRFIILVNAITDANPECTKKPSDTNQAKGKATCPESYWPQSPNECVDSEDLKKSTLVASSYKTERTHESGE